MEKRFSLILAVAMIFVTVLGGTSSYAGSDFVDMPNNWAKPGLEHAVKHGLLEGNSKNEIRPEDSLTREQLAAISVRLLGLKEKADLEVFKDFKEITWSHDALSKAVAAGILEGSNGRLNPKKPATRQEVFVVMARAFMLEESNTAVLDSFKDGKDVSNWAKEATSALVENKYIEGNALNRLNPKKSIRRQEFAKMLMEMATDFTAGSLKDKTIDGNLIANSKNIDLDGVTIKGDLILGEGVELSDINLSNTKIEGRIVVRAGSELKLKATEVNKIVVSDKLDDFTAELDRKSAVDSLVTESRVTIKGEGRLDKAIFKEGADGSKLAIKAEEIIIKGDIVITDGQGNEVKPSKPAKPPVDSNTPEAKAKKAIEKAEKTMDMDDVDAARNLVEALEDGKSKEELTNRLNKIQQLILDVWKIEDKIELLGNISNEDEGDKRGILVGARALLVEKGNNVRKEDKLALENAIAKANLAYYEDGGDKSRKARLENKLEAIKPLDGKDTIARLEDEIREDLIENLYIAVVGDEYYEPEKVDEIIQIEVTKADGDKIYKYKVSFYNLDEFVLEGDINL